MAVEPLYKPAAGYDLVVSIQTQGESEELKPIIDLFEVFTGLLVVAIEEHKGPWYNTVIEREIYVRRGSMIGRLALDFADELKAFATSGFVQGVLSSIVATYLWSCLTSKKRFKSEDEPSAQHMPVGGIRLAVEVGKIDELVISILGPTILTVEFMNGAVDEIVFEEPANLEASHAGRIVRFLDRLGDPVEVKKRVENMGTDRQETKVFRWPRIDARETVEAICEQLIYFTVSEDSTTGSFFRRAREALLVFISVCRSYRELTPAEHDDLVRTLTDLRAELCRIASQSPSP